MEKLFCPGCGNSTLLRTSVGVDSKGNVTYYLKKNFQYNNRGTQYSIPTPKGGRNANNMILREDQREMEMAIKSQRTQKSLDVFDIDYVPLGDNPRKESLKYKIGHGRKNPNAVRGRRR